MRLRFWAGLSGVIVLACLCGCPKTGSGVFPPPSMDTAQKSGTKQEAGESLAQAPELGPELTEGSYALSVEKLEKPLWFNESISFMPSGTPNLASPASKPAMNPAIYNSNQYRSKEMLEYTLDLSGKNMVLTVAITSREKGKEAAPAKVTKITGQLVSNGKPGEKRIIFAKVPLGGGVVQTLGVIVPESKEPASLRGYILINECLKCEVPQGANKLTLRVLSSIDKAGKDLKALWIDDDKNGELARYEVENMEQVLGITGRLYQVSLENEKTLKLAKYAGETGYLALDSTDGKGNPAGIERLRTSMQGTLTYYIGKVKAVQVMAGNLDINYNLPVDEMQAASASFTQSMEIKNNQTVKVKAGGPVKAEMDAFAAGETVQVTPSLMTSTGHGVEMSEVTGRTNGLIEVLDADGKVLDSGKAEYG